MKIYKFRPLANYSDLERAEEILNSGQFWCSKFFDLNDPMEWVFTVVDPGTVRRILEAKTQYTICSFSDAVGVENPLMWGHYANGFRGIAIEVEVDRAEKVSYVSDTLPFEGEPSEEPLKRLLTTKLKPWEYESEYRILEQPEPGLRTIGTIIAVYFGQPYGNTTNVEAIVSKSATIARYRRILKLLTDVAKEKGYECRSAVMSDGKVVSIDEFGMRRCFRSE